MALDSRLFESSSGEAHKMEKAKNNGAFYIPGSTRDISPCSLRKEYYDPTCLLLSVVHGFPKVVQI